MRLGRTECFIGQAIKIQIPIRPIIRNKRITILDVELNGFGSVTCLGYYVMGADHLTQILFIDPISPAELVDTPFFKLYIIGSNKIACYFADHEQELFNLTKERMIETMSVPYYAKEKMIQLQFLDMISGKYLPTFSSKTANLVAFHNMGCVIKTLILLLGKYSFNRMDFARNLKKNITAYLSVIISKNKSLSSSSSHNLLQSKNNLSKSDIEDTGISEYKIPFTRMLKRIGVYVVEVILNFDNTIIDYIVYYDFESEYIRVLKTNLPAKDFKDSTVFKKFIDTYKFTSYNIEPLKSILRITESRIISCSESSCPLPSDYFVIEGLSNYPPKPDAPVFDKIFFAYTQVVKATMMFILGSEIVRNDFRTYYNEHFKSKSLRMEV